MSSTSTSSDTAKKGRRISNRRHKAIENAKFTGFAGLVVGVVLGILIAFKFNIGQQPVQIIQTTDRIIPATPRRATVDAPSTGIRANSGSGESVPLTGPAFYNGAVHPKNPLRGLWTAQYNSVAIVLNFTEDGICEVYNPVASAGESGSHGELLASFPVAVESAEPNPTWTGDGVDEAFTWPKLSLVREVAYTNRDGSSGIDSRKIQLELSASYEGLDTPTDTDDFIQYELLMFDGFFDLEKEIETNFSTPTNRTWERQTEGDFRDKSALPTP